MATRIAGVNLEDGWKVGYALTKIKGIGWSLSEKIIHTLKIDEGKRVKQLSDEEVSKIASEIDKEQIEGELARVVKANISRLRQIGAYRGLRHAKALPVRGQRTRSNARTKRGKRKTIGAFKKEALAKVQKAKEE